MFCNWYIFLYGKKPGQFKLSINCLLTKIYYEYAEYNNMPTPKMKYLLISGPPYWTFLGLITVSAYSKPIKILIGTTLEYYKHWI